MGNWMPDMWQRRYASDMHDEEQSYGLQRSKPNDRQWNEDIYRHPITGNGLCGAPGGCARCGKHLAAIKNLMASEIFPKGRSNDDHELAIGNDIQSLSAANNHWMSNPHGHMGKSPTQHLAGMIDQLKGHLKTVQALDPSELGAKAKQNLRGVFTSMNPFKGYAGGKTAEETNFEEDGPLPQL